MKTKNILISLGVVVLLVLGVTFPRSGGTVVERIVGAQSGPDSTSPYNSFNGVEMWSFSSAFNNASTTLCSFKNNSGATTTATFASIQATTATSTAIEVDIAVSPSYAATTTKIASTMGFVSGAKWLVHASTTNASVEIPPNYYLNYKFVPQGTFGDANALRGTCRAILIKN